MPSGISVPHMFIVTFVIMLPIALATGDPIKGWEAGLVWVFFQSFILMIGGFIAPYHPQDHAARRAARHAGRRLDHLHLHAPGAGNVHDAGDRPGLLRHHHGELVRRRANIPRAFRPVWSPSRVGMLIAWGSNLFGLDLGGMSVAGVKAAFSSFGFSVPIPAVGHVFSGFQYPRRDPGHRHPVRHLRPGRGDGQRGKRGSGRRHYPTTRVLTADGVVSLIGCLMGNPFINAVYIGHPGWKAMGGRIGYSAATGVMVIVLSWFGVISLMLAVIPVVAISPILLYIGMLIGAQAFQTTPPSTRRRSRWR